MQALRRSLRRDPAAPTLHFPEVLPAHWSSPHVVLVPDYPSQSHLLPSLHCPWTTAAGSQPPAPSPSPSTSEDKEQNQIFGFFSEWAQRVCSGSDPESRSWIPASPTSTQSMLVRFPVLLTLVSLCTLTFQVFYFVASPISLPALLSSQHLLSLSTLVHSPVKCCSPLLWFSSSSGFLLFFFFLWFPFFLFCFNYCSS